MSLCADSIKPVMRTAMSAGNGITKTQVYYPSGSATRPRSYSAGCSTTSSVTKRANPAVKVTRLSYPRAKVTEECKSSATRYKTELCRPFQDYGFCRYGDKCQFAHGEEDLRVLPRHPKYKTDLCRTYHTRGFCPYGSRCHFIHNLDEARSNSEESSPPSPTKKGLNFSLPISPSLDSGISSPDDIQSSNSGSEVFDFPGLDSSSGSGSEDSDYVSSLPSEPYHPLSAPNLFAPSSLDKAVDYDSLSVGSSSPTKKTSEVFDPEPKDLNKMMQGLQIRRENSGHRLPVFDNIACVSDPFSVRSPFGNQNAVEFMF